MVRQDIVLNYQNIKLIDYDYIIEVIFLTPVQVNHNNK